MSNFYVCGTNVWDNVEFWKQNSEENYVECIQDLIQRRPFGDRKFYIFSFVKRVDDSSGIKKMHHQPRLTRPEDAPIDLNAEHMQRQIWKSSHAALD